MLTAAMIMELDTLKNEHGELRTEDIVELARRPDSALHKCSAFEWDIGRAAMRQWMDAARSIVQAWVGIIQDPLSGEKKTMRVMVTTGSGTARVYAETRQVLLQNRATIVNAVCDRLVATISSYPLPEFNMLLDAIEQIRLKAATTKRTPARRKKGGKGEARVGA